MLENEKKRLENEQKVSQLNMQQKEQEIDSLILQAVGEQIDKLMEIFKFNKQFKQCYLEISQGSEKQTVEMRFGQRYNI